MIQKDKVAAAAASTTRNTLANGVTAGEKSIKNLLGKEMGKTSEYDVIRALTTKINGKLEILKNANS